LKQNFNDNEISYVSGPLEDKNMRKNITDLLEGGKDAFLKREKKYLFV